MPFLRFPLLFYHLKQYFSSDMVAQFFAGGTAGVIQWLPPIYSLDVIKSRMQAFPKGYYNGWLDCAQKLYREEGIQVFYRLTHISF